MTTPYERKHRQHLLDILNTFRSEVHGMDLTDLLAMKKRLNRQMSTGASLSLVTVDNSHAAILHLNALIADREDRQRREAGMPKSKGQSAVEYIVDVMMVSESEAARLLEVYGDPREKYAGTATQSNTDIHYLDEENS